MTPDDFMGEIALPTALEYKAQRRSRRLAYLSCIAAFHLKDHLKEAGEVRIEAAMRAATGNQFDVVRGICNGTKHVETDASHPIPFRAGTDVDRPPGSTGSMQFGWSRFGDTIGGRDVSTGAGAGPVDIYAACTAVLRAYVATYPHRFPTADLSGL